MRFYWSRCILFLKFVSGWSIQSVVSTLVNVEFWFVIKGLLSVRWSSLILRHVKPHPSNTEHFRFIWVSFTSVTTMTRWRGLRIYIYWLLLSWVSHRIQNLLLLRSIIVFGSSSSSITSVVLSNSQRIVCVLFCIHKNVLINRVRSFFLYLFAFTYRPLKTRFILVEFRRVPIIVASSLGDIVIGYVSTADFRHLIIIFRIFFLLLILSLFLLLQKHG